MLMQSEQCLKRFFPNFFEPNGLFSTALKYFEAKYHHGFWEDRWSKAGKTNKKRHFWEF